MAQIKPYPPVRPMDPAYVSEILTAKNVNTQLITAIKTALEAYNDRCNEAVDNLENDLNNIFKNLASL